MCEQTTRREREKAESLAASDLTWTSNQFGPEDDTTSRNRTRRRLDKVRRSWKRRFQSLHERLEWFHWETRERRYMLQLFGKGRLP